MFDGDGLALTGADDGGIRQGTGIDVQADGKIILSGTDGQNLIVARMLATGGLDATFGTGGLVNVPFAGAIASKVLVQPDGKILVGVSHYDYQQAFDLFRFLPNGTLDSNWGSNGDLALPFQITGFEGTVPTANNFALMPDTRIVIAGTGNGSDTLRIMRVLNDDAVVARPLSNLLTTEAGGTATFTVRLSSPPTADVIVPIASSDTTEGTTDVPSLTFTTDNWNAPQTVTITGVNDNLTDSNQRYTILIGAATSDDPNYNGKDGVDVFVRNRDDETVRFNRLYNPYANFHFFTTSAAEFEAVQAYGYNDETSDRSGFALSPNNTPGPEFQPLFRLYNLQKGYHYYTFSVPERDALVALTPPSGSPGFGQVGWRYEGSPGFIAVTQAPGTSIIYRLYNTVTGAHFFTESGSTRDAVLALSNTWEEHSPLGYAYVVDDLAAPDLSASGATGQGSTQPAVTLPVMKMTSVEPEQISDEGVPSVIVAAPTSGSAGTAVSTGDEPASHSEHDAVFNADAAEGSIAVSELDLLFEQFDNLQQHVEW